jgi:hypothetical protein
VSTLEVRRFVVISTGHVTKATAKRLDAMSPQHWPCAGGPYGPYGWFVYAHDENAGEGDDAIPDDLFAVMSWARGEGFDYVLLDHDGDMIDALASFDW